MFSQVLSMSPEHPALVLQLRQLQCERLLLEQPGTTLPVPVLEQLSAAVMANPTAVSAWHVSYPSTDSVLQYLSLVYVWHSFQSSEQM